MTIFAGASHFTLMDIVYTLQFFGTLYWVLSILGAAVPVFFPSLGLADTSKYGKSLVDPRTGAFVDISEDAYEGSSRTFRRRFYALLQKYSVPKKWFTHYYILATISNFSVLYWMYSHNYPLWSMIILAFYTVHCFRRLYECFFVHAWSDSRMSFPLYVLGLLHYVFAPISLLPICRTDKAIISIVEVILAQFSALSNIVRIIGVLRSTSVLVVSIGFFLVGNFVQYKCHKALAELRVPKSETGATSSAITTDQSSVSRLNPSATNAIRRVQYDEDSENVGGIVPIADPDALHIKGKVRYSFPKNCRYFRYTLSPHYTAELAIYAALVSAYTAALNTFDLPDHFPICNGTSMSILAFSPYLLLLWVGVNLAITALRTKEWYIKRYPNNSLIAGTAAIFPALL